MEKHKNLACQQWSLYQKLENIKEETGNEELIDIYPNGIWSHPATDK